MSPSRTGAPRRGAGTATTAFAELGTIGGVDYGLWEMSTGAMRDIEGDEAFLVIAGTGRIEFDDPRAGPSSSHPAVSSASKTG